MSSYNSIYFNERINRLDRNISDLDKRVSAVKQSNSDWHGCIAKQAEAIQQLDGRITALETYLTALETYLSAPEQPEPDQQGQQNWEHWRDRASSRRELDRTARKLVRERLDVYEKNQTSQFSHVMYDVAQERRKQLQAYSPDQDDRHVVDFWKTLLDWRVRDLTNITVAKNRYRVVIQIATLAVAFAESIRRRNLID